MEYDGDFSVSLGHFGWLGSTQGSNFKHLHWTL